ncbi:MAG: IS1 family transposase [Saprospiraceae bacterium]|nr:IS1 family transposase [Saprospiraceae bacterium]
MDKKKAQSLPDIVTTLLPAKKKDVLELDELWSFVYCKDFKRWVWIALCRRTRQIVSFFIGDRSEQSCRRFWELVPPDYRKCRTFSDFWEAYAAVVDTGKHKMVGKESGETAHVERWNNTLRQRICRFVRKTLSFSKSDEMHQLYLHLFVHNYNLSLIK